MAGRCDVCGRRPQYGKNVSHSNRHTNRRFVLNIRHRHLPINGVTQTLNICTRCLRTITKLPKAKAAQTA